MSLRHLSQNAQLVAAGAFVTVALILFALALGWRSADQRRNKQLALSTNAALCAFKHDIQTRAEQTQRFLNEIVSGDRPPIPGISVADLSRSLDAQRATLASLEILNCKEAP